MLNLNHKLQLHTVDYLIYPAKSGWVCAARDVGYSRKEEKVRVFFITDVPMCALMTDNDERFGLWRKISQAKDIAC
jgi:hypothetical protein